MKLGTRLLVALLPTIGLVMLGYGLWAQSQRQEREVSAARRETEAYALALAVAVEYARRSLPPDQLRSILDDVSHEPKVYGISVYDTAGRPIMVTGRLRELHQAAAVDVRAALDGATLVPTERVVEGEPLYTVLRPLHDARGRVVGVLEVAQPLGFVHQEVARVRNRYLLNTATLLLAVTLLTLFMVRRFVSRPMQRFVEATNAVGRGDLRHRLDTTGGGELAELGTEFNRMAAQLDAARTQLLRETDDRVALERRLRESEKMASIGQLAAGLAHEIAAPLNVISGRAELVLRREGLADEQQRSLRIIVAQIRRITTIVRNLLDFGRRREARRLRVDLAEVVDGALQFLDTELAGAAITVRRPSGGSVFVEGDPDHLHQVLVNLILNATQAIGDQPGERWIELRLARAPAAATLDIADSGPGVDLADRDRLFQPFFTTKPSGSGMGLVVSRSIMEELGGTLELDPDGPARGAVFRLTLPLAADKVASHG